jgi:hypothetical protein
MSSIQNRHHPRPFPSVPLKIVGKPAEDLTHFRITYIGSETAALLLNFSQGFWAFRHDGG